MSVLNPELFLRDEIEFELRARGRDPKRTVIVLRRQLREALSAGEALLMVAIADKESEFEKCNEKREELQELARCVDNLEEGPGCSIGVRRIRQCLQHVIHRLQNLEEQWGDLEPANDVKISYNRSPRPCRGLNRLDHLRRLQLRRQWSRL